jgi:chromosome segregation ATPase
MAGSDITIDEKSGISVEEQKEIIAKIDKITEKNRERLSESEEIVPKKKDYFFPMIVNIAAVVLLGAGALLLISFNAVTDKQVKTGNVFYDSAEKALIEEIRKDTAQRIEAKEKEIASIASRLQEVDRELSVLQSSNEELSSEQLETQNRLLALQLSYRSDLSSLQDERSRILEESRLRESILRSQLEERSRDFAAAQQRVSGELDSAMRELDRLSSEQERMAAIDAQFAGGLAAVSVLIQEGQYAQATGVIESLRSFTNNNSLASSRSYQVRKVFYNQAIDSMERIVGEMLKFQEVNGEGLELLEANAKMTETIAEMQKTIDAYSSGSSGQTRRLSELEDTVSTLRATVATLESNASDKDRTISSLENDKRTLTQTVAERDGAISTLQAANEQQERQINTLNDDLTRIRNALQQLSQ